jgi:hypothetical protein
MMFGKFAKQWVWAGTGKARESQVLAECKGRKNAKGKEKEDNEKMSSFIIFLLISPQAVFSSLHRLKTQTHSTIHRQRATVLICFLRLTGGNFSERAKKE